MGAIEGEDAIKADIRKLFEDILIYSLSNEESSRASIQALIDELKAVSDQLSPEKKTFLSGAISHAQIIISKKLYGDIDFSIAENLLLKIQKMLSVIIKVR